MATRIGFSNAETKPDGYNELLEMEKEGIVKIERGRVELERVKL